MNVIIHYSDLDSDVREALRRRAAAENKPPLEVGCEVLAQALHAPDPPPAPSPESASPRKEEAR